MRIPSLFKRIVPEYIKTQLRHRLGVPSQAKSFLNLKKLGFAPKTVIDIGAYEGNWAVEFENIFPGVSVLMIEGQSDKEIILKNLCVKKGFDYRIALLGASEKVVNFNVYDTASSVLEENNETGARKEVRTLERLDKLLEDTNFSKPDLIKLDTQGYELEVLKGGESVLSRAQAVLIEVSMIDVYKNVPLVDDVLKFMKERNLVLYDICSLMKRPVDNALYQSDFLFIKQDSFLRNSKRWS